MTPEQLRASNRHHKQQDIEEEIRTAEQAVRKAKAQLIEARKKADILRYLGLENLLAYEAFQSEGYHSYSLEHGTEEADRMLFIGYHT